MSFAVAIFSLSEREREKRTNSTWQAATLSLSYSIHPAVKIVFPVISSLFPQSAPTSRAVHVHAYVFLSKGTACVPWLGPRSMRDCCQSCKDCWLSGKIASKLMWSLMWRCVNPPDSAEGKKSGEGKIQIRWCGETTVDNRQLQCMQVTFVLNHFRLRHEQYAHTIRQSWCTDFAVAHCCKIIMCSDEQRKVRTRQYCEHVRERDCLSACCGGRQPTHHSQQTLSQNGDVYCILVNKFASSKWRND